MNVLPIAVADLAVVGILLLSGLLALVRGFVREVLAVASWIGAVFATLYGIAPFTPLVRRAVDIPLVTEIVAGATIFIVSLIVFGIISRAISRAMHVTGLGILDRTLGFLFGLARGALIVCVIYLFFTWLGDEARPPTWMADARTLPLVQNGSRIIESLIPSGMRGTREARPRDARPEQRRDVARDARRGAELQTLLRSMMQAPAPGAPGGYAAEDRAALEGTIQGVMQQYQSDPDGTDTQVREIMRQNQSDPDNLKRSLENLLRQNQ